MDFFSHGLWAGVAHKAITRKIKTDKPISAKWTVFWGVFPDLFAFALSFAWLFLGWFSGSRELTTFHQRVQSMEPAVNDTLPIMRLTNTLYNFSHSFFIFAAIFLLVWLVFRKPKLAMFGWLFHVLIDIPSHSYRFYPTPFLWPLSDWKFNGISWGTPWFLIANYVLIVAVYWLLRKKKEK